MTKEELMKIGFDAYQQGVADTLETIMGGLRLGLAEALTKFENEYKELYLKKGQDHYEEALKIVRGKKNVD